MFYLALDSVGGRRARAAGFISVSSFLAIDRGLDGRKGTRRQRAKAPASIWIVRSQRASVRERALLVVFDFFIPVPAGDKTILAAQPIARQDHSGRTERHKHGSGRLAAAQEAVLWPPFRMESE